LISSVFDVWSKRGKLLLDSLEVSMYLDVSLEKWVVKPLGWLRPIFIFKYFLNYLDLRFYMFERFDQSSWVHL
jgi:hypothetical protein